MRSLGFLLFILLPALITNLNGQSLDWAISNGGSTNDQGETIATDQFGNSYIGGIFSGIVDFDPSIGVANRDASNGNGFIQKLDSTGNLVWVINFGFNGSVELANVVVDDFGNLFVIGIFSGITDFDPDTGFTYLTPSGGSFDVDVFIQKISSSGKLIWVKSFGGPLPDIGYKIHLDPFGNLLSSGYFQGTADLDPGPGVSNITSGGLRDIFIQKLDSAGNFKWARGFSGPGSDYGWAITTDDWGNVYSTGSFADSVDFDPGIGVFNLFSTGLGDIYVNKLDSSGNFKWAKSFGNSSAFDWGYAIDTDKSGNVYSTGQFSGTVDFDPGPSTNLITSNGSSDCYVLKLDSSGNYIWVNNFGGFAGGDSGEDLFIDDNSNVYVTGQFRLTASFNSIYGPNSISAVGTSYDAFIHKMDSSGTTLWARSFGGPNGEEGSGMSVRNGSVYITGIFGDTADFNPGLGNFSLASNGLGDIFVVKLNECNTIFTTDTINACYSYTWIDSINYTNSNNTAIFPTISFFGCDSIINLNLTIDSVSDITTTTFGSFIFANNLNASYQWLDCNNNYAIIIGDTNSVYFPTASGNYAVELNENGCIDTSACVPFVIVNIDELDLNERANLFPNPTRGKFYIDLGRNENSILVLIKNSLGQEIKREAFNHKSRIEIDFEGRSGLYFVELINGDNERAVMRITKR